MDKISNGYYYSRMSKPLPPSRTAPQFVVRFPDESMREQIAEAAKANGRSMNAEIVARLERSFSIVEDAKGLLPAIEALAKVQERQEVINTALIAALTDGSKLDAGSDVLSKAINRLIIEVGVFDLKNHTPDAPESTAHRLLKAGVDKLVAHDTARGDDHAKSEADKKYNKALQAILDDARDERDSKITAPSKK